MEGGKCIGSLNFWRVASMVVESASKVCVARVGERVGVCAGHRALSR